MAINSLSTFQLTVAAGGVAEPLSATKLPVQMAYIQADSANTTSIFIGNSSNQFFELTSGSSIELRDELPRPGASEDFFDLNGIFVKSATISDKVNVVHY